MRVRNWVWGGSVGGLGGFQVERLSGIIVSSICEGIQF